MILPISMSIKKIKTLIKDLKNNTLYKDVNKKVLEDFKNIVKEVNALK